MSTDTYAGRFDGRERSDSLTERTSDPNLRIAIRPRVRRRKASNKAYTREQGEDHVARGQVAADEQHPRTDFVSWEARWSLRRRHYSVGELAPCEENMEDGRRSGEEHGSFRSAGSAEAQFLVPLKAMGRFIHEQSRSIPALT